VAVKHLATPDFKQKLAEQAAEAVPSSSQEFSALIKSEIQTWAPVIRAAGVQPD
jgi:tripartite-type tricarboxylate transporter receptor subunit TctC